jgi:beta-glucanase (GH16 family)
MHRQNGTSGGDQDELRPSMPARFNDWHTTVIEWTPEYLRFLLDGTPMRVWSGGRLTDCERVTSRIPNTPMRWVLQSETELNATYPAKTAVANVQVDYVKTWKYAA